MWINCDSACVCVPVLFNASFIICLLPSESLSHSLPICCSLTLNKIIHSFSQVFPFFQLSCCSSPSCQFHTHRHTHPKKKGCTLTYMHCQVVFTHSCMQLPATRRYLDHETLWPVLFISSIKIARPWMSMNLPSVCMCRFMQRVASRCTRGLNAPSKTEKRRKKTCFLSHLHHPPPLTASVCPAFSKVLASKSHLQVQTCRLHLFYIIRGI